MNLHFIESSQRLQKRFDNLNNLELHIYLQTRISFSNDSKISSPVKHGNNVISMLIVNAIVIVKVSDNSQWLLD
jgi:hypothetical protein